jgi:hypothetical protein
MAAGGNLLGNQGGVAPGSVVDDEIDLDLNIYGRFSKFPIP